MSTHDIDYNRVKTLLKNPYAINQKLGIALLSTFGIPDDKDFDELISDNSDKLMYCLEYGLADKVRFIKTDEGFVRKKLSLADYRNTNKLYVGSWGYKIDFGKLYKLEVLSLSNTWFTNYNFQFRNLKNLRVLYMGKSHTSKIREDICNLDQLQVLNLSNNRLSILPFQFSRLENLYNLNLRSNRLCELIPDIGSLENLKILNLSNNNIQFLPSSFVDLSELQHLNLSQNKISKLPKGMEKMLKLEKLILSSNPIVRNRKIMIKLQHMLPQTEILF
jgi:Leucine-rich repeat (LRR) protein